MSDFWVGDSVYLIKSARHGKIIQLTKDGKAKVQTQKGVVNTPLSNLKLASEISSQKKFEEIDNWVEQLNTPQSDKKVNISRPKTVIDLHMHILAPEANLHKDHILEYQLNAFTDWLDTMYFLRKSPITVIHGKGKGVLRKLISDQLQNDHRVSLVNSINDDGALEVWFK